MAVIGFIAVLIFWPSQKDIILLTLYVKKLRRIQVPAKLYASAWKTLFMQLNKLSLYPWYMKEEKTGSGKFYADTGSAALLPKAGNII